MASTKRSTRTPKPSQTAAERIYARYVQDLRRLLEQSARREEKLAGMVQAVIDERFFRPVVTSERPSAQNVGSEMGSDVEVFDETEDSKLIATQQEAAEELARLYREQFGEESPAERQQEDLIEA